MPRRYTQAPRPSQRSSTMLSVFDENDAAKPGPPDVPATSIPRVTPARPRTEWAAAAPPPVTVFVPAGDVTMDLPWHVFSSLRADNYDPILRFPVSTGMGFAKVRLDTTAAGLAETLLDDVEPPLRVRKCAFRKSESVGVSMLDTQDSGSVDADPEETLSGRYTSHVPPEPSRVPQTPFPPHAVPTEPFSSQPRSITTSYLEGVDRRSSKTETGGKGLAGSQPIFDDTRVWNVLSPAAFSCPGMYLQRSTSITTDFVYRGGPKVWLVVKPASTSRLEECIGDTLAGSRRRQGREGKTLGDDGPSNTLCHQFFNHDKIFVTKAVLDRWDITYSIFHCAEGDVAIIPPGTYFQVVNAGPCLSQVARIPGPGGNIPYRSNLRPCGETCGPSLVPACQASDDAPKPDRDDDDGRACHATAPVIRTKLPESRRGGCQDGGPDPCSVSEGGHRTSPRRGRLGLDPPSPPSSGDDDAGVGAPARPGSVHGRRSTSPPPCRSRLRPASGNNATVAQVDTTLPAKSVNGKRTRLEAVDDPPVVGHAREVAGRSSKRTCLMLESTTAVAAAALPPKSPRRAAALLCVRGDRSETDGGAFGDRRADVGDDGAEDDIKSLSSRDNTPESPDETADACTDTKAQPKSTVADETEPATTEPAGSKSEAFVQSLLADGVERCEAFFRAWRAAPASSALHLPPCDNRVTLYRNIQQAKSQETLARYRKRLAHIQLSTRLKKPGSNSAAVYRSRSDIHSLTCEVLGIDPSSADTTSRTFRLQRADISRCLYTGTILDTVCGDGLDFLPALPPGKLGLTLSDSHDVALRLAAVVSENGEDGVKVKHIGAFGRLFAAVVQGQAADALLGLDVELIAALSPQAPAHPPNSMSRVQRLASHEWGLADELMASIDRSGLRDSLVADGCAICTHRRRSHRPCESLREHCAHLHPFVRIWYSGNSASEAPRLQAVRHPSVPALGDSEGAPSPATIQDQVGIVEGDVVAVVPGEVVPDHSVAPECLALADGASQRWRDLGDAVRIAPGVALRVDKRHPFIKMLLAQPTNTQASELEAKVLAVSGMKVLALVAASDVKNGDTLCVR